MWHVGREGGELSRRISMYELYAVGGNRRDELRSRFCSALEMPEFASICEVLVVAT